MCSICIFDFVKKLLMTPERKEKFIKVLSKRQPTLTVVLENVFDPHNVFAVLRTCDAVGIQDVFVLNTITPWKIKVGHKSSSSASKWMSVHEYDNLDECVAELRKRNASILTTHLGANSVSLHELDMTGNVALVFGNEHSGVTDEFNALADGNFMIPQVGIISSLNISVACAVTLYEAMRQKKIAGHYDYQQLSDAAFQKLFNEWSKKNEE